MHADQQHWYHVYFTSGWDFSGYDYPGEAQALADKISDRTGLETAVLQEEEHHRVYWYDENGKRREKPYEPYMRYQVLVRAASLRDLDKIQTAFSCSLVYSGRPHEWPHSGHYGSIEIYDDYRE